MNVQIKIHQATVDNLIKKINAYEKGLDRKVEQATAEAAIEVQKEAKLAAPTGVSGDLRSRISVSRHYKPAIISYIVGVHLAYAAAVEFGSGPHKPPIKPLKLWAKRKLGDENAAYAVRNKIAKEGTRPQPFLRPAYRKVVPEYKRALKRILRSAK